MAAAKKATTEKSHNRRSRDQGCVSSFQPTGEDEAVRSHRKSGRNHENRIGNLRRSCVPGVGTTGVGQATYDQGGDHGDLCGDKQTREDVKR